MSEQQASSALLARALARVAVYRKDPATLLPYARSMIALADEIERLQRSEALLLEIQKAMAEIIGAKEGQTFEDRAEELIVTEVQHMNCAPREPRARWVEPAKQMSSLTDWTNETPERRRAYEQERLIVDVTEAIHELMRRKNVTKADLAKALGTSKSNVTQLFSGNRNMTLRSIAVFASVLGLRAQVSFVPEELPEGNPSCWDCPPVGYPTDETRCAECPRRRANNG